MNISDINDDGIGLDGFDPVAYFEGEPLKGVQDYRFTVDKVTYLFANLENLERFTKEPAKYIPIAGSFQTKKTVGNLNDADTTNKFVGSKSLQDRSHLDDVKTPSGKKRPNEMKEDGDIEMQNLSDSDH